MNRTRKWGFVAQEAQRLAALGLPSSAIARRIGVAHATVNRWLKSGKLTRPASRPVAPSSTTARAWAAAVRAEYQFSPTDDQLVSIAESMLSMSMDASLPPNIQMAAAGRFQSVVRQLALGSRSPAAETPEATEKPAERRSLPRRPDVDPRTRLH